MESKYSELNSTNIKNLPMYLNRIKDSLVMEYNYLNLEDKLILSNWINEPKTKDSICILGVNCKLIDSDDYVCDFCIYEYIKSVERLLGRKSDVKEK